MNENDLMKLDQLADLMDNKFVLPGTDIRIGLDSIIGVIPGIGDTLTLLVSGYIIHKARKSGIHPMILSQMIWNVGIDWAIGLVPFVGDAFDVGWKANRRNVDLIKAHVQTTKYQTGKKGEALFI